MLKLLAKVKELVFGRISKVIQTVMGRTTVNSTAKSPKSTQVIVSQLKEMLISTLFASISLQSKHPKTTKMSKNPTAGTPKNPSVN